MWRVKQMSDDDIARTILRGQQMLGEKPWPSGTIRAGHFRDDLRKQYQEALEERALRYLGGDPSIT